MKKHALNNFDFFRFLMALFVVISHSFPLSGIAESEQWIYKVTNGQLVYASVGLNGFFVISGYFIFQSMQRSEKLKDYFLKRALRIFPGLLVVLLCSLVLAAFVYQGDIPFYKNKDVYTYIPYNLLLYGFQGGIEGVFDTNFYHAINGSLWTIRYEFSLYIAVALLFCLKKNNKLQFVLILIALLFFYISYVFFLDRFSSVKIVGMLGYEILNLGTFFIVGSLLALLKFDTNSFKKLYFYMALLVLFLALYFNFYNVVKHIIFPILILFLGHQAVPFISTFGKYGDASYGIYIYSFPIQQALIFYFSLKTYELLIGSCFLSIIIGYLSWHFIEKRALKFKNTHYIFK